MTEEEWLSADDPGQLLLHIGVSGSARKLRLFAVACCQRISHRMLSDHGRCAIEMASQHADGLIHDEALLDARSLASDEWDNLGVVEGIWSGPEQPNPFEWVACEAALEAAFQAPDWAAGLVEGASDEWEAAYEAERTAQVLIYRDIFGNPFRRVAFDPQWRSSDVTLLAKGIYADRVFDRMPILADALQDAGCDSTDLLDHLRDSHATHVRGCWVVDLILSKDR